MTPNETELFAQLERLAAHCPWEKVDIWTCREPEGSISFTAYAAGLREFEIECAWGHGPSPEKAVDKLVSESPGGRNPEAACKQKIAKLEMEIMKLKSATFTLAPYRPTPMIGGPTTPEPPPAPAVKSAIEVETVTVERNPDDVF